MQQKTFCEQEGAKYVQKVKAYRAKRFYFKHNQTYHPSFPIRKIHEKITIEAQSLCHATALCRESANATCLLLSMNTTLEAGGFKTTQL